MKYKLKIFLDFSLVFLTFLFCFWNLGEMPLERWDEFTNAAVVRESIASQSFPVLTLNNEPFMEKPPLWYYLTILSTKIFGESNFAFRAISGLSGFILIILIAHFTRKNFGYYSSLLVFPIAFTCWHLFYSNIAGIFSTHNIRSADLDILQILFTFISLMMIFEFENSKNKKFIILAGIFGGLGFMTKGAFALMPILIWIIWLIYSKNFKSISTSLLFYFPAFLLLALPWHIFMFLNFGNSFFEQYLGYHVIQRTITPLEGHNQNILFHIFNLANPFIFMTGIFFFFAIYWIWKSKLFKEFKFFYLVFYSLSVLIIVTLIQTKLSWYLLQIYPYAIILISWYFSNLFNRFNKE